MNYTDFFARMKDDNIRFKKFNRYIQKEYLCDNKLDSLNNVINISFRYAEGIYQSLRYLFFGPIHTECYKTIVPIFVKHFYKVQEEVHRRIFNIYDTKIRKIDYHFLQIFDRYLDDFVMNTEPSYTVSTAFLYSAAYSVQNKDIPDDIYSIIIDCADITFYSCYSCFKQYFNKRHRKILDARMDKIIANMCIEELA